MISSNAKFRSILQAVLFTVIAPLMSIPFLFLLSIYWAFFGDSVPGAAFNLNDTEQFFYNFKWAAGNTQFDLWLYSMIFFGLWQFSLPIVFILNWLGQLLIRKIINKRSLSIIAILCLSGISFVTFIYSAYYYGNFPSWT